jgi:hypothetical protein
MSKEAPLPPGVKHRRIRLTKTREDLELMKREATKNQLEKADIIMSLALHPRTCKRCLVQKSVADFVVNFQDPTTRTAICRECMIAVVQKPEYMKDALTNILKEVLSKDGYSAALEMMEILVNKAIFDKDMVALKFIMERMDGPLTQKVEMKADQELKRLVDGADALRASIRGEEPPEEHVH